MELKTQYQQRVDETERELQIVRNKILRISSLRVVLFLAGIFGVIYGYDAGAAALCLITALTFVPFLILVKFHNRLFFRKEWLETCIRVNQDEISALDNNYEPFDEGAEFVNAGHRYSLDLDIFGHHSLFQAMNRTCTSFGKNKLAEWLQKPLEKKEEIRERQTAVSELAGYDKFRECFRITGLLYKGEADDRNEIKEWTESSAYFSRMWWSRPMLCLVPSANVILLALGMTGVISMSWFGLAFGTFVVASFGLIKHVTNLQGIYDKKLRILSIYAKLIALIDRQEMKAPLLARLKAKFGTDGKRTSEILKELATELDKLDLRNNQIM